MLPACLADLGGRSIKVISAEDLIASKLLAGRPKDIDDVRSILRVDSSVDQNEVMQLLSQFEQALDRSDLRAEFERLARSSRGRTSEP